jgi:hypothetical protein
MLARTKRTAALSQAQAHAVDELERSLALAAEHGGHTHPQVRRSAANYTRNHLRQDGSRPPCTAQTHRTRSQRPIAPSS